MDKIVKPLRTLRRMGIKELQESVALPEQTVYATIFENKEYFNVKGKGIHIKFRFRLKEEELLSM